MYGKERGHHCWWLTKDGKSLAHFDKEEEVDAIIDMQLPATEQRIIGMEMVVEKFKEGHGLFEPFEVSPNDVYDYCDDVFGGDSQFIRQRAKGEDVSA